ncbi:MAG: hypothetical protein RJB05_211 [Armatimonadota bacterium]|jgi:hypothetical protein
MSANKSAGSSPEVRIGLRVEDETLTFFGTEEVNFKIAQGWTVVAVNPGDAYVDQYEEGGEVFETLAGADLVVVLKAPGNVNGAAI